MSTKENCPLPDVDIWVIRIPHGYHIDNAQIAWLDDDERARARAFDSDIHRNLYLASHIWLRKLLGQALLVPPNALLFSHDAHGKPHVNANSGGTPQTINFSLSHTTNGIACAIAQDCLVGVDIEHVAMISDLDMLVAHTLHPLEIERYHAVPEQRRLWQYYQLWAAKESLLKAIGTGLNISPSLVGFIETYEGNWYLADYPASRIGEVLSCTYIKHYLYNPHNMQRGYAFAVSALVPMANLTIHQIHCGPSTADAGPNEFHSSNVTIGVRRHASIQ